MKGWKSVICKKNTKHNSKTVHKSKSSNNQSFIESPESDIHTSKMGKKNGKSQEKIVDPGKHRVILDTDPGGDDVMAILWLAAAQKAGFCDLLALTSAEGNATCRQTYETCQRIMALMNLNDIPIGRGVETGKKSDGFNGEDGLGGTSSLLPAVPKDAIPWDKATPSDDLLIEILEREPVGTVSILAVAPLTNLAAAEKKKPGILRRARDILLMGGAFFEEGNVTPLAEFNIWFNPEALRTVLAARNDIMILPVDVTTRILFGREQLDTVKRFLHPGPATEHIFDEIDGHKAKVEDRRMSAKLAPSARLLWRFIDAIASMQIRQSLRFRQSAGKAAMVLHDSAAVAALFYPEKFRFQRGHVLVEDGGSYSRGKTFIDVRGSLRRPPPNAFVGVEVEGEMTTAMFVEDFTTFLDTLWHE